jgi:hypothetical protein
MKAWFEDDSGKAIPFPEPMSPEQGAVVMLMKAVGIRRIDADTIDEFVRRADLYSTYVTGYLMEGDEYVAMTRKVIVKVMAGHPAIWSDGDTMGPLNFDRMIRLSKTNRLTNQQ